MVKIKTKKQLNLPQLIEWAWGNGITNKEYICDGFEIKSVVFNLSGWVEFSDEFSYNPHDTFTVEVEEEITEDTKIPQIIEVLQHKYSNGKVSGMHYDKSVNEIISGNNNNDSEYETFTLHILNDDGTHTLIWRDGKLVE